MQELGLRCKFWVFSSFLAKLSFNGVSALGCKATVNALTHKHFVATDIDHRVIEMMAAPLKSQDGKCTSVLFQNKATSTYGCCGGREGSSLAAASTSPGRGSTIHVTIAKSLGVTD